MDMNILFNRLKNEKNALEHPRVVKRFLRETDYLREKPAKRRLLSRNRKLGLQLPVTMFGVLAVIVVFIRMF